MPASSGSHPVVSTSTMTKSTLASLRLVPGLGGGAVRVICSP
jgi:hypothetical protein